MIQINPQIKPTIKQVFNLQDEILWFNDHINSILSIQIDEDENKISTNQNTSNVEDRYMKFVKEQKLNLEERLVLILSVIPYIQPEVLDVMLYRSRKTGNRHTVFGGVLNNNQQGLIPTVQTALFVLAGYDVYKKNKLLKDIFHPGHKLFKNNVLYLQVNDTDSPYISHPIKVNQEFIDYITTGRIRKPVFSEQFPAKLLTTKQTWDDLILPDYILQELEEIKLWIKYEKELMHDWGLDMKVKPGYRSLFYGFPGTGKSFAAALIGKSTNRDVYRIDLSLMVSKWVGETEKNLSRVFDKAENKDWILFFDEADSLFGQRSKVNNSQDRYGNQGVSYLLQRIEDYPGVVLMATNLKSNLDEAFYRRFQSVINFPRPKAHERWLIWKRTFETLPKLKPEANLRMLANEHDISGSNIINAVRYATLMAISQGKQSITHELLEQGIIKEKRKEGKML